MNNLTPTQEIIAGLSLMALLLTLGFAAGRYTAKPEVKIVEKIKTDTQTDTQKNVHTIVKTIVVKEPTGEQRTETTTDTTSTTDTEKHQTQVADIQQTPSAKSGRITVQGLIGMRITEPGVPLYGIAASKEFIGPVSIGAFGLTNGTVGLSLGVSF